VYFCCTAPSFVTCRFFAVQYMTLASGG